MGRARGRGGCVRVNARVEEVSEDERGRGVPARGWSRYGECWSDGRRGPMAVCNEDWGKNRGKGNVGLTRWWVVGGDGDVCW